MPAEGKDEVALQVPRCPVLVTDGIPWNPARTPVPLATSFSLFAQRKRAPGTPQLHLETSFSSFYAMSKYSPCEDVGFWCRMPEHDSVLSLSPLFVFVLHQIIQYQTVRYDTLPLSPISRNRLSKYLCLMLIFMFICSLFYPKWRTVFKKSSWLKVYNVCFLLCIFSCTNY